MIEQNRPYLCHVLVCANDRRGERQSCADHGGPAIRSLLKEQLHARDIKGVRVSQTGCLGQCQLGPNVMLEPQGVHFIDVTIDDVPAIVERIARIVASDA